VNIAASGDSAASGALVPPERKEEDEKSLTTQNNGSGQAALFDDNGSAATLNSMDDGRSVAESSAAHPTVTFRSNPQQSNEHRASYVPNAHTQGGGPSEDRTTATPFFTQLTSQERTNSGDREFPHESARWNESPSVSPIAHAQHSAAAGSNGAGAAYPMRTEAFSSNQYRPNERIPHGATALPGFAPGRMPYGSYGPYAYPIMNAQMP